MVIVSCRPSQKPVDQGGHVTTREGVPQTAARDAEPGQEKAVLASQSLQASIRGTLGSQKVFRECLQHRRGVAAGLRARTKAASVGPKPGLGRGQIQARCESGSSGLRSGLWRRFLAAVSLSSGARLTAAVIGRNSRKSGRVSMHGGVHGTRDRAHAEPRPQGLAHIR